MLWLMDSFRLVPAGAVAGGASSYGALAAAVVLWLHDWLLPGRGTFRPARSAATSRR